LSFYVLGWGSRQKYEMHKGFAIIHPVLSSFVLDP